MPDNFSKLFRQVQDRLIQRLVDEIYRESHTDLSDNLPVRQLVEHYPDILSELGLLLDSRASSKEIAAGAMQLRDFIQVRFHAGVLIDEMARELMLLRKSLNRFLWQEEEFVHEKGSLEFLDAIERTNLFVDELIVQAIVIYAASWRPPAETRSSIWPPPRRR